MLNLPAIRITFLAAILSQLTISDTYSQAVKDPKAQEILKGVSAKYKSAKTISASFKVNTLDQKTKKTDLQTGSIILKGDKYKLSLKGQEIWSDGKTSWTYLKESNEVQINNADTKSNGISPTNIFTIYENGFSTKYIGEVKVENIPAHQIELVPTDSKKSYFKITVYVSKTEKFITGAKIFEKSGTVITYSVDKLKFNIDAPDNSFSFDKSKYSGVEEIDLR